jgi:hypothetical protein
LNRRLTDDKAKLSVVLVEDMNSSRPATQRLAVLSLGAIDNLPHLLDALESDKREVREGAVAALRHWLGRGPGQEQKLRQALEDKRYNPDQAETALQLLHTFSNDDRGKKQTYEMLIDYLKHDQAAVRQLASWHLARLVPEGGKILYNPVGPAKERQDAFDQWRKLLADGSLPPKLSPPMPPAK